MHAVQSNALPTPARGQSLEIVQRNAEIQRQRALPPSERPSLAELSVIHNLSRERIRQIADGRDVEHRDGCLLVRAGEDATMILERVGDGRFEAFYRRAGSGKIRVGVILGGRRRWTAEPGTGDYVQGSSLKDVATKLVAWLDEDPRRLVGEFRKQVRQSR